MVQQLLQTDIFLTQSIYVLIPHTPTLDYFFSFFSQQGSSILIWVITIVILIFLGERKDKRFVLYFLAVFGIALGLTTLLKNVFIRPRPDFFSLIHAVNTCPIDYSFPSGHAATAFAVATVLAYFDRKRWYVYFIIASLIAFSRIYLGCHYVGDIIIGAILGIFFSKVILYFTSHKN